MLSFDLPFDGRVAEMIRHKLDAGILPAEAAALVWSGHGTGQPCVVCDQPIVGAQTEYEAQYDDRPAIRFHFRCHRLWREELRRRDH